ncbi:HSP20-like chaperone, partial [Blyttiomyces helicus]
PEVLWAQRTDELFLTISVSDVEDPKITLTEEKLVFQGTAHGKNYSLDLAFHKEVNPEASKQSVTARNITFVIAKKEVGQPYWPRLLSPLAGKPHYLKTDFSKWRDEDDDE